MIYWNTVNEVLKESLIKLMHEDELKDFRLVGGTALSLYLGHRMSIDIDLFTDAPYRSIDFDYIELFLKNNFGYINGEFGGNPGMGKSYLVGPDVDSVVKLDLYYTQDPFFQKMNVIENVRMATIEEIIAMKVDVVQRVGRKKDFWDLHELLRHYSINEMIALHKIRFEWTHNEELILENFTNFVTADNDLDPVCLRGGEWQFIREDLEEAVQNRS